MAGHYRKLLLAMLFIKRKRIELEKLRVAMRKAKRRRLKDFNNMQCQEWVIFLLYMLMSAFLLAKPVVYRQVWIKTRSSEWWDRIVMASFNNREWIENFRMQKCTFMYNYLQFVTSSHSEEGYHYAMCYHSRETSCCHTLETSNKCRIPYYWSPIWHF